MRSLAALLMCQAATSATAKCVVDGRYQKVVGVATQLLVRTGRPRLPKLE